MFTNADCLINKRTELDNIIAKNSCKLDIIGIVEVKAKSYKDPPLISEFAIQGYDVHVLGRGVILYTATWLKASPFTPKHSCEESIWAKVKLRDNDSLIIGCTYRSPSSSTSNDEDICRQIKAICSSKEASHLLIFGDFNYPDINWESWSKPSVSGSSNKFLNTLKNSYLYQHVTSPTRACINQQPSTLDLLITNEEGMVSNLEVLAPLGKSDHGILSFQLHCYTETCSDNNVNSRDYNKGNYDDLRKHVAIDWVSLLNSLDGDVKQQFHVFTEILQKAVEVCVPYSKCTTVNRHNRAPMDKEFRKLNGRKHRLWTRYMETKDIGKYREYCKCRNKVRTMTRAARRAYEKQLVMKVQTEPGISGNMLIQS